MGCGTPLPVADPSAHAVGWAQPTVRPVRGAVVHPRSGGPSPPYEAPGSLSPSGRRYSAPSAGSIRACMLRVDEAIRWSGP